LKCLKKILDQLEEDHELERYRNQFRNFGVTNPNANNTDIAKEMTMNRSGGVFFRMLRDLTNKE
jgi:hypothetical protein